jgi:multidrug resistance protein, MATE family
MVRHRRERLADVRAMLRIALPLALAELGWMAMAVVDTVMVGRLPDSAAAIGATSVGGALFYAVAIFGIGIMSGLDTLVSHAYGASDMPQARRAMRAGFILAACFTPPLMAVVAGSTPLLGVIGVEQPIAAEATGFITVLVWSLPLLLIYTVLRRYLQGIHHVRPVAWALISSNVINVAGNWLLIYGRLGAPRLGIEGSALSTVISRVWLAAFLLLAILRRDPSAFRAGRAGFALTMRLLRLGLPAAFAIGFEVWVFNLVTALVATLDPVSLAAHTIALNAASVTYMVPLGISSAAAVSVGRAWGAGDLPEAGRAGWNAIGLAAVFEVLSSVSFLVFPRAIAQIYTADPHIIAASIRLLAIAAAFQMFDGLQTVAAGALRGLADTRTPMVVTLIAYWAAGLPLGCWLCYGAHWGVVGIWWGFCLSLFLIAAALLPVWAWKSRVAAC